MVFRACKKNSRVSHEIDRKCRSGGRCAGWPLRAGSNISRTGGSCEEVTIRVDPTVCRTGRTGRHVLVCDG